MPKIAADFPFTAQIGIKGRTMRFEEGEEDLYFDWLLENKDAIFMWRGCVDVVAICNPTQLKIDIDVFNPEIGAVEERQSYELSMAG